MLELQLSRTAKSGFKGVTKTSGKSWQARIMIDGKLHHVHSSRKPRECAIRLALAERLKTAWENGEMARYEAEEMSVGVSHRAASSTLTSVPRVLKELRREVPLRFRE